MKKILSVLLLLALVCSFAACNSAKTLSVQVSDVLAKMTEKASDGEMYALSVDSLSTDYGIQTEFYKSGSVMKSMGNINGVETIAFFEAANTDYAEKLKTALKGYVDNICKEQKDYNAENYEVASAAVVTVEGNYVYLIMSANKSAIQSVVDTYLK